MQNSIKREGHDKVGLISNENDVEKGKYISQHDRKKQDHEVLYLVNIFHASKNNLSLCLFYAFVYLLQWLYTIEQGQRERTVVAVVQRDVSTAFTSTNT
jgi:hypothetical protein